jgi:hypothetical protein
MRVSRGGHESISAVGLQPMVDRVSVRVECNQISLRLLALSIEAFQTRFG